MQDERNLFVPADIEVERSTFHNSPTRSGTCMAGRLIPAWHKALMPGTGIKMRLKSLFKMSTPVYPTMDRLFADVYFFFVPNRLVMHRRYGTPTLNDGDYSWSYFIGAQDNLLNMPLPNNDATMPAVCSIDSDGNDFVPGSLADYFHMPAQPGTEAGSYGYYNPLPVLSYIAVYNENFRDPSTMTPYTWSIVSGASATYGTYHQFVFFGPGENLYINTKENEWRTGSPLAASAKYGLVDAFPGSATTGCVNVNHMYPLPTCVHHGYFGSMLPWPQRNSEGVPIPLQGKAKLDDGDLYNFGSNGSLAFRFGGNLGAGVHSVVVNGASTGKDKSVLADSAVLTDETDYVGIKGVNLYADLSTAVNANVNALRAAIQQQRWYEKLARSGNRYDELEYGTFGVRPKDSGGDRPQYLGGQRIELSMEMVASTNGGTDPSSGSGTGSLGALGAFSHTNSDEWIFASEFDDWGTLLCVFTIRHHLTFSSGAERSNLKNVRDELYFPCFAHLGEQKTWASEIANEGGFDGDQAKLALGYQQAWEEERTDVDRVCGLLRKGQSLGFMTYAEYYQSYDMFVLSDFLNASRQIKSLDDTLAVKSYASGFQFVYQLTFDYIMRAPIPVYSIPGLMDHF